MLLDVAKLRLRLNQLLLAITQTEVESKTLGIHRLQAAMNKVVDGVGGLEHRKWRRFHNERRTGGMEGFVDGDLIELFLELSNEQQRDVLRKFNDEPSSLHDEVSLAHILDKVEEMSRMH